MKDEYKSRVLITLWVCTAAVAITGIITTGGVLGFPTRLIPGNLRAERAEIRADEAEAKQSRAERDAAMLERQLHPRAGYE